MGAGRGPAAKVGRVVLVGMMGSGKSTVGRLLAARTGWPYVDNDQVLRRLSGSTPRRILDELGEAELRRLESAALWAALETPSPCIVAAAAGTILDPANRRRLRDAATVIWLRASVVVLARRAVGAEHRAWLDGDAAEWFAANSAARDPLFEEVADVIVDTDSRSPSETADEILARLASR
jgi:shikimate kinase